MILNILSYSDGPKIIENHIRDLRKKISSGELEWEVPKVRKEAIRESASSETSVTFSCDLCSRVFTLKKNLNSHKKRSHENNNLKYSCNKCSAIRKSVYDMKYHFQKEHGENWNIKDIEKRLAITGKR